MRRLAISVPMLILFGSLAHAQMYVPWAERETGNYFTGGFGVTWIDNQPYYLVNLSPEFSFGKIGIGFDVNLRFSPEGKLRSQDFKEPYDYFRTIRYVRYGMKHDPIYARVGILNMVTLGYGIIMQWYTNSPSYEYRKLGTEFAFDFRHIGFEGIYSDFNELSIVGGRAFVRPLKFTSAGDIPIIGDLDIGLSYVTDFNRDAGIVSVTPVIRDTGHIAIYGADIGLPVLNMTWLNSSIYAQAAKIAKFGSGQAVGIDLNVDLLGLVRAGAKLERRFIGAHFIPSYFGPFYELERYQPAPNFNSKIAQLVTDSVSGAGIYGELRANVIGAIEIVGALQTIDGAPYRNQLHLGARLPRSFPSIYAEAAYDKNRFANFREAFTLPRSLLSAILGYKPYPFLLVSMLYQWTFTEENGQLKKQVRVEPRVSFIYTF